jgi:transposase InsO family protein
MIWGVRSKVEARLEFVRRLQAGERMAALCREFEISRPTGYLWKNRHRKEGTVNALYDRTHRPYHCPNKIESRIEKRICKLRKKHGWGGRKLSNLLRNEGIDVPSVTVNRVIKRNNLLIPEECSRPALMRFARSHPNDLWQADFKGPMGRDAARCEPLSVIDDHSRFVLGLDAVTSKRHEEVQRTFQAIFEEYGVPEALLLDHGVPWWSTSHFLGFSTFSAWLMNQDIRLIFSGVNHPQTQGKVERFHRSLARSVRLRGTPARFCEWKPLLKDIRQEFNYIRPHEAMNMDTPSMHYVPSTKRFNPKPQAYEYPNGAVVIRLDNAGRGSYKDLRIFVSQALAGQHVCLVELQRSIVVFYRNTPVREVLSDGSSQIVCAPGTWSHRPFTGLRYVKSNP